MNPSPRGAVKPGAQSFVKESMNTAQRQKTLTSQMTSILTLGLIKDGEEVFKCRICDVVLDSNLLSNKKHTCRFCGENVCEAHSLGRREKVPGKEPVRICDHCDLSNKGKDIQREYETEILALNNRVLQLEESKDRCIRENQELASTVISLEAQLKQKTFENQQKRTQFEEQREEIREKVDRAERAKTHLLLAIDEKNRAKITFQTQCSDMEAEVHALQSEVIRETNRKEELWTHLQDLSQKQASSLTIKFIEPLACDVCTDKLRDFQRSRGNSGTTGAVERSFSVYSAVSSVSEKAPSEEGKKLCLLM